MKPAAVLGVGEASGARSGHGFATNYIGDLEQIPRQLTCVSASVSSSVK